MEEVKTIIIMEKGLGTNNLSTSLLSSNESRFPQENPWYGFRVTKVTMKGKQRGRIAIIIETRSFSISIRPYISLLLYNYFSVFAFDSISKKSKNRPWFFFFFIHLKKYLLTHLVSKSFHFFQFLQSVDNSIPFKRRNCN